MDIAETTDRAAADDAGGLSLHIDGVAADIAELAGQWAAEEGLDIDPDRLEAEAGRLAAALVAEIAQATRGMPADEADELVYDRVVAAAESIDLHALSEG